jgi:hypothetical protein
MEEMAEDFGIFGSPRRPHLPELITERIGYVFICLALVGIIRHIRRLRIRVLAGV